MKKSNISGWRDVFSFTLIQTLKSKAFIVSYIILLAIVMVSMPIINMLSSNGLNPNEPSPVKKVYINNTTALGDIDFTDAKKNEAISHIVFEPMKEDYDVVANRIENSENESVILTLSENEGIFSLNFVKASKGPVKDSNIYSLESTLTQQFELFRIKALGITDEQLTILESDIETIVNVVDAGGTPIIKEDTSISNTEYWFIYGILFVVLMVNVMASTQVATSIVTEKSTKVVEYLLMSVRPLALMVGKILAMLSAVLIQMVSMMAILFLSNKVSAAIFTTNGTSALQQFIPANIFDNLNIFNIILCLVLIILGLIFYATLAGVAGATISKIEELNEGLTLFTITNLIGAYVGLGAASVLMGSGMNGFVMFAFLFPLSSPFLLPGAILVGKVGLPIVAISIIIQILSICLLLKFVAKIYETLILHNGNKIKLKELIHLSKTV
jgi:ABC-2 type transport system permease protein